MLEKQRETRVYREIAMSLSDADEKLLKLEERLAVIENNCPPPPSAMDPALVVAAYQAQVLDKLRAIRESLLTESGDFGHVAKERDAALAENAQLKKEIEKLNYRINHLIKALNEEEAKNKV